MGEKTGSGSGDPGATTDLQYVEEGSPLEVCRGFARGGGSPARRVTGCGEERAAGRCIPGWSERALLRGWRRRHRGDANLALACGE